MPFVYAMKLFIALIESKKQHKRLNSNCEMSVLLAGANSTTEATFFNLMLFRWLAERKQQDGHCFQDWCEGLA